MRKLITTVLILFTAFSYTQADFSSISAKDLKKITKKLDLKVTNRGFDGSDKIYVNGTNIYHELWGEVLFDLNIPIGYETGEEDETLIVDARWVLEVDEGGFSGKILDLSNDLRLVLSFSTTERMFLYRKNTKRSEEFKSFVKVILKQIYDKI